VGSWTEHTRREREREGEGERERERERKSSQEHLAGELD
jgi:hypothetical protein